ncbi:dermonecrotic toxin domain-containing protein [Pseudomonas sp. NPDC090233]|uniref:dermonecrotic toxin domain-containing protein n=1 Tax=Pseudomonas sp. NPDC090233 TaxID=3364479 RepID=UPI00383A2F81
MQQLPDATPAPIRQALNAFPRPDQTAETKLSAWLATQGITESPLQLDVITFHYQVELQPGGVVRNNAVITGKMNLVEAFLANWRGETAHGISNFHFGDWAGSVPTLAFTLVDRLKPASVISNASPYLIFNGLYRRTQPSRYAPDTRVPIRAEALQEFIAHQDLRTQFTASLDAYWARSEAPYQQALKIAFIQACNRQVHDQILSEEGRDLIWRAAGLVDAGDLELSMLNVYGYTSTSILQLKRSSSPLMLLYIPGNSSPLHEFDNEAAMKRWFAEQCRDPAIREVLLTHFARADWPDGLDFSGLRTALEGLGLYPAPHHLSTDRPGFATSGVWDPQHIVDYRPHTYNPRITGDLFHALAQRQKHRSYADSAQQIISNADIRQQTWSHYLNIATTLLAPLVIVLPELAPLLVIGGLAQFSLGLDAAVNGKSVSIKEQGVSTQVYGLLNALASAPAARLAPPTTVFRYARPGFFSAWRLQEVLDDAVGAAPIVPDVEIDAAELSFREAPVISADNMAIVVTRIDHRLNHRFMAWLQTDHGVVADWVAYEFTADRFVRSSEMASLDPPRWELNASNPHALVPSTGSRVASLAQRMATLKALGIDLQLPVTFDAFASLERTPIPAVVHSVWLGERLLSGTYLEALAHNAEILRISRYRYQIYLSRQNQASYLHNIVLLRKHAPGAFIMPLEDQGFFQEFKQSPYFPQYRTAISEDDSARRNAASACDILRYRLLNSQGGLYLDADDRLLPISTNQVISPLERIPLKASPNDLILAPPVSNDRLGMYIKYNNSMIGSHPQNPTLEAVSNEILRRFELDPGFYARRPSRQLPSAAFLDYSRKLSLMTGPGVLNAVIDTELPALRQLRECCSLLVSPLFDLHSVFDLSRFNKVLREYAPLDLVARTGSAHSWAEELNV